jgi:glycosylphosphatidylinositol transamidase (GPIT) subunit GPI8
VPKVGNPVILTIKMMNWVRDIDEGVAVIDRFTYYNLETFEGMERGGADPTLLELVN